MCASGGCGRGPGVRARRRRTATQKTSRPSEARLGPVQGHATGHGLKRDAGGLIACPRDRSCIAAGLHRSDVASASTRDLLPPGNPAVKP